MTSPLDAVVLGGVYVAHTIVTTVGISGGSSLRYLASNFQTRESANSSLDQVDTKMISEIALLSQSAPTTQISVVNSDWLSNNWLC